MSRKKWGKTAAKTERVVRDAILKPDVAANIDEYLQKARSVTQYDLANRFGVRMSVARQVLRRKESEGVLIPYIREGGLEVYTTPAELEKRESEAPIMIADALEEVASSVPKAAVITEEMDAELIAASEAGSVMKPSRLARQRREAGEKKEEKSKAKLPEVIVEPLAEPAEIPPQPELESAPEPKKKVTKKKAEEEAKPKKKVTKKKAEEEAKPKKKVTKKKAEEKAKPKKKVTRKKAEEKPKRIAAKKPTKKTEDKSAAKKTATKKTTKKADEKPKAKKTTKKSEK
ncbi:MAG: hypothetical protein ACFFER_06750 [Candidatus Thorarchaeota archaeon]